MKKIYMIAAAALLTVTTAGARELKFCQGDKVFNAQDRLVWNQCKIEDYGADGKDYVYDPGISILSDVDANDVIVTATCTTGQNIQLCCGGSCEMGTSLTKRNIEVKAGVPLASQLEQTGQTYSADEPIPHVEVELTAQYADDPSSLIKLEMVFDSGTGITTIVADNDFCAVQGGIRYNLTGASEVNLYDMTGRRVFSEKVSGSGIIPTAALPVGIYVYCVEGSARRTGKLFVR